ncbi:hypothetical protein [Qipengyuania sp.]|uniref:hypothetical protein n=1 Tax=Qipengyuania sp. TaxID=2004515 RepID=UPI0035C7B9E6
MDSESSRRPFAYVRAVKSLDDREDGHLGVGMAARPIGGVPINVHLEGRVYLSAGSQQIAPAAFVSGGIDDVVPKLGASVRGYAQAGYVGGQPDTQFVDGNLVLGKKIPVGLNSAMAIGAGVWGGAEKNVARLELGPSADVVFPLGSGFGRLEASYRWRVGEEDTKDAGAAVLTLSAGF